MEDKIICPSCNSEVTYFDGTFNVCAECGHLWDPKEEENKGKVFDSNGNELQDGDTVYVIKDLPVKGSSNPVKRGTKVTNIRLLKTPINGHDIACRIDGFGSMNLKSEFVKK